MLRFFVWSFRHLSSGLAVLSAGLLFVLMMITTVDVVGRYVFNNPLAGSTELIELFLGLLIFATIPLLCRNDDHVVVDLVENHFSAAFRRQRDKVMHILMAGSLLTLSYGLMLLGKRAQRDALVSEILALPVAWFLYAMALLLLCAVGFVVFRLFRSHAGA